MCGTQSEGVAGWKRSQVTDDCYLREQRRRNFRGVESLGCRLEEVSDFEDGRLGGEKEAVVVLLLKGI
jgi:hypothetical protein